MEGDTYISRALMCSDVQESRMVPCVLNQRTQFRPSADTLSYIFLYFDAEDRHPVAREVAFAAIFAAFCHLHKFVSVYIWYAFPLP